MRQILLLASILLLGLSWAIAQDTSQTSPSSGQSSAGSGQTSSGETGSRHMGKTSAGGETTVEGCLSGSSGNYTLTDKHGNTYQLTGDTAKLSQHVGHEVKVTGSSGAGEGSASGGAAAGSTGTAGAAGSQQTLQVTSVKHVSKTCQSGSGMSH